MLGGADREGTGMAAALVRWPDEIDEVTRGDLTAAAAYITPERVEQCVFALVMVV
jgi:hypothetical protein